MNKKRAREILGDDIKEDGSLHCLGRYLNWNVGDEEVTLDADFSVEELEAIAWWVGNRNAEYKLST